MVNVSSRKRSNDGFWRIVALIFICSTVILLWDAVGRRNDYLSPTNSLSLGSQSLLATPATPKDLTAASSAAAAATTSSFKPVVKLPETVEYVYINIGTSWDPWPGCGLKGTSADVKGHNNNGGMEYDPKVFCIYVEPLMRVNMRLHERGQVTNSSLLIHAAVSEERGLAPFNEYAGTAGVASSLGVVSPEILKREQESQKGPFTSGDRGQSWTTVVTLKDILDIVPKKVRILQLKTDMQGFDVTALRSAHKDIERIDEIFHECQGAGETLEYVGAPVPNTWDMAKAQLEQFGFEAGTSRKHDCNWRRKGSQRVEGYPYVGRF